MHSPFSGRGTVRSLFYIKCYMLDMGGAEMRVAGGWFVGGQRGANIVVISYTLLATAG